MKRALLLAVPLLALGAPGCTVDNAASIQIQGVCVPPSGCTFSATCDSVIVANPTLDSSVTKYMTLFFQLANELPDNSNADTHRLNTNNATVEQAVIDYSGALAGVTTIGVNQAVPAAGTAIIGIDVIPGPVGAGLTGTPPAYPQVVQAVARVRLKGHYGDGSSFETAAFPVSVDVTTGAPQTAVCLGACPQVGQYPAACP